MTRFKFDTHIHTSETSPCGVISGAELIHLYKDSGYQGLVITDHYRSDIFRSFHYHSWEDKIEAYLKGYRAAYKEGKKLGLRVLLGIEISFEESLNDYLVYGIDEDFLLNNKELYKLGLKKFKQLAKDNGILVYQAHPFRPYITPADPNYLDGVEIFNGNRRHDSHNASAYAFAKDNNLKMLSGSDFHQEEDLASGGIILSELPKDSKEFLQILKDNSIVSMLP